MIDLALLREKPEYIIGLLKKKEPSYDAQRLHDLDVQLRKLRVEVEELRKQKNELAKAGQKGITDEVRAQSITLSKELKEKEVSLHDLEHTFQQLYLSCPNVPEADLPEGG